MSSDGKTLGSLNDMGEAGLPPVMLRWCDVPLNALNVSAEPG